MPAPHKVRGGTRGAVYREVAQVRMGDAAALLAKGRFNGAIYLAGYAIECQLKFAYCRRRDELYLPERLEVHDWDRLIDAAGLLPDIQQQSAMEAIYSALVDKWGPSLRYRTGRYSIAEANRLYNEMEELYGFFTEIVQ
jgi:hypothetical protein